MPLFKVPRPRFISLSHNPALAQILRTPALKAESSYAPETDSEMLPSTMELYTGILAHERLALARSITLSALMMGEHQRGKEAAAIVEVEQL